jgi:O-antigen ligase
MDAAAFILLLLFAVGAPLLSGLPPRELRPALGGGAVAPSGSHLLCVVAFLLASLTFLSGPAPSVARLPAVPMGAMRALAVLGAVQLLPLPERILGAIAPANLKIYHETGEILGLFGRTLVPSPRISIAPGETMTVVLLLVAYFLLFQCASRLLRTRGRRRLFAGALFASALFQIVWGAAAKAAAGRIRGTFANPNHLAAYLEIVLAFAFAALWVEVLTNRERAADAVTASESFERRFPAFASRMLIWSVIAAGIVLTQSRGAVLAAGLTTAVLLVSALRQRRRHGGRAGRAAAAALLAGAALAAAAAGTGRFSRFLLTDPRDLGSTSRAVIWKVSVDAWREFPIVGSGLGTFREAFVRVQPRTLPAQVEEAHDDLLQLAVTGGAVGAALGIALFAALFVVLWRLFARQRHREESAFVLAGFGALLSLTLHGTVDFGLSIPVVPATLACALGGAWVAGHRA